MDKETDKMSVRSFAIYPETYEELVKLKEERQSTWDEVFCYLLSVRGERVEN